jgi:hypothetical protein
MSMSNTWLIILGVALVAAGVFAWILLSPGDDAIETGETVEPYVEEVVVEVPVTVEVVEPAEVEATTVAETPPLWAVDGVIDIGEYANTIDVIDVEIHWTNDANVLRVALESPGTGYVAIGFDPERRMEGANFIIGYVQEGVAYVRDDFGTGPTSHAPDDERGGVDNVLSAAGSEWADHTVIEFVIPLDSGDEMDKPLLPGGTYSVLVAYHDLQDGFTARHSRTGAGEITLDLAP